MTVALYASSLSDAWVYEDVRPESAVQTWAGWRNEVSLASPRRSVSRWVALATHAVSDRPMAAHVVSLALHLLVGVLAWRLAALVLSAWAAVFAMGLVLLHPLTTEVVAYAAVQSELLMAVCVLLALLAASSRHQVVAFLACVLAVVAKEAGIVSLLLVPLWMQGVRGQWRWTNSVAWLGVALLPAWWVLPIVIAHGYGWPHVHDVVMGVANLGSLLWLLMDWRGLTVMHDWWLVSPWVALWLPLALMGAYLSRTVGLALAWVLLSVLPNLLWPLHGLSEHRMMLPLMGVAVACSAAVTTTKGTI